MSGLSGFTEFVEVALSVAFSIAFYKDSKWSRVYFKLTGVHFSTPRPVQTRCSTFKFFFHRRLVIECSTPLLFFLPSFFERDGVGDAATTDRDPRRRRRRRYQSEAEPSNGLNMGGGGGCGVSTGAGEEGEGLNAWSRADRRRW